MRSTGKLDHRPDLKPEATVADNVIVPEPRTVWSELPPDAQAAAWEEKVPGSARLMFEEVQRKARHARRMAVALVCLRVLLILCAFGSVVLFVWLATYFVNHDDPTQGAAIVGAGLATLVGAFLGQDAISRRYAPNLPDDDVMR